jgi:hypothetical protein
VRRFRRLAPLVFVAAIGALWLVLGRKLPHAQTLHVILGSAAPRVTEVRLTYAEGAEAIREATFHWAEGAAPRIVTHEPRLADGEYRVHIEVTARNGHATVERTVKIEENPVSIDVQEAVQ